MWPGKKYRQLECRTLLAQEIDSKFTLFVSKAKWNPSGHFLELRCLLRMYVYVLLYVERGASEPSKVFGMNCLPTVSLARSLSPGETFAPSESGLPVCRIHNGYSRPAGRPAHPTSHSVRVTGVGRKEGRECVAHFRLSDVRPALRPSILARCAVFQKQLIANQSIENYSSGAAARRWRRRTQRV